MQACVKNSVQRGGSVCQGGVCAGVSSKGGSASRGVGVGVEGWKTPLPQHYGIRSTSGRYASYLNASLFSNVFGSS